MSLRFGTRPALAICPRVRRQFPCSKAGFSLENRLLHDQIRRAPGVARVQSPSITMKASPLTLTAAAVLWLGTVIGAWQLGRHRGAGLQASTPCGINTRFTSDSRGGSEVANHNGRGLAEQPLSVKQVFARVRAAGRPGSMESPMAVMRALAPLDKLRPEDIPAALAEAEGIKDRQSKSMALMVVLGKWSEQDGSAAMKYAENHAKGGGPWEHDLKMSVASSWAKRDPEAAWTWYQSHKEDDFDGLLGGNERALPSIFEGLMNSDPDTAFRRLGELDKDGRHRALAGMGRAALRDEAKRLRLLDFIKGMPDVWARRSANETVLDDWFRHAPDEVIGWVAKQPPEVQRELRDCAGSRLVMTEPKKGAAFMLQGATAEERPQLYSQVVGTWGNYNPNAAIAWLEKQGSGPELDPARHSLACVLMSKKPAAAMIQALAITDAHRRTATAATVYHTWHATDAAAADHGMGALGLTAEQMQQIKNFNEK